MVLKIWLLKLASPGSLLEVQIIVLHPTLLTETRGWAPEVGVLTGLPGDAEASSHTKIMVTMPTTLKPQDLKGEQLSEL